MITDDRRQNTGVGGRILAIVELDKIRTQLAECEKPMNRIRKSLDMEGKKRRIEEIEVIMEEPGFWDDVERSTKSMGELKSLKDALSGFETLEKSYEEIGLLIDMAEEEHDEPGFRHTKVGLLPHYIGSLLLLLQLIQPLAALLVNIARTEHEEYDEIKEKAFHDR